MRTATFLMPALAACLGCTAGSGTPSPPSYDANTIATAAFAKYDKNKNQKLDPDELDACPSIKSALALIDTDKDKAISLEEFKARLHTYIDSNLSAIAATAIVSLDGRPLIDATVTLTPEDFMGGTLLPATGKTDAGGAASLTAAGSPGMACGFYRVSVSRKTGEKDDVPAKYNSATILGHEIALNPRSGSAIFELKLTSK